MFDLMKWNIALARLSNFIETLPLSPSEDHVFQYHEILSIFEEASGEPLSEFRIAPDPLNRRIHDARPNYLRSERPLGSVQYARFSLAIGELVHHVTNKIKDGLYPVA
jgi:hypothetical protein